MKTGYEAIIAKRQDGHQRQAASIDVDNVDTYDQEVSHVVARNASVALIPGQGVSLADS